MAEISNVEKEIFEEIVAARENIRKEIEVFPSSLDKDNLIEKIKRRTKYRKYFTSLENAEKLADKEKLLLNTAKVNTTFDVGLAEVKASEELVKEADEIDKNLGVINYDLVKRLTQELDTYLENYPSMKVAQKLVIVGDDIKCIRDIIFDTDTWDTIVRYRFILNLKIFVS